MDIQNKEDLANLVRNYVHYDNLTTTLNKQTHNARIVRDDFEKRIIENLKSKNMDNAIIQIVGGKLKIVEENHFNPLSFKVIEDLLHQYYASKKISDDTTNIIKYIKSNRKSETLFKIKKLLQLPSQPPI
jgi:hypothetical protein